jgi:L-2,4-diaminobutyric acid acetyltransferase
MKHSNREQSLLFRMPHARDGLAIHQLIQRCPPLDLNSSYSYYLLCQHFAETCVVVEQEGRIGGFLSAYRRPDRSDTLFFWQAAVDAPLRGQGVAQQLLEALVERPACAGVRYLETTIAPSNIPSRRLFYRFAEQRRYPLEEHPFLDPKDFGDQQHEAERLVRIGPITA